MTDWLNKRAKLYWYEQYALNEQETAFSNYDPDRITQEILDTGADIIALYAANQYSVAYYPSRIWPQHPNLNGIDYFGDLCNRLRSHGKKIIAYISWLESRHPEWTVVPISHVYEAQNYVSERTYPLVYWADPSEPENRVENMAGGQWRIPCINSPRRDQILEITREIVEMYQPDMFNLDMFSNYDICVCAYCMPTLNRICKTKRVIPESIKANWNEYIKWRTDSNASFMKDMSEILVEYGVLQASNALTPEFLPVVNGQDERCIQNMDVSLSKYSNTSIMPGLDLNTTSLALKWQLATGLPAWELVTSCQPQYAHSSISEAQWKIHASACKANGCKGFGPCGATAQADTSTRKLTHNRIKNALEFFIKDADLDVNAALDSKIALIFSWATRRYTDGMYDMDWLGEFNGWGRFLIEEHLPFDVVVAENSKPGKQLSKYDLVILPDIKCLSEEFCNIISEYVKAGGKVIATNETSLKDIDGNELPDFKFSELFGANRISSVAGFFAFEGPTENEPEPALGKFQKIKTSAKVISKRLNTDPAGSVNGTNDPMPVKMTDYPAAILNNVGKGDVLYVAFQLGWFFDRNGDEQVGKWMAELVGMVMPNRQLDIIAPRTVEVTCWKQENLNRKIIHIANRTVPWTLLTTTRQITEIVPVYDIKISLDMPYKNVKVSSRGTDISYKIADKRLLIDVNKVDAYAAIIIENA